MQNTFWVYDNMAILFQILKHRLDKKKGALYIFFKIVWKCNKRKKKKKVVCFVKILTIYIYIYIGKKLIVVDKNK